MQFKALLLAAMATLALAAPAAETIEKRCDCGALKACEAKYCDAPGIGLKTKLACEASCDAKHGCAPGHCG